MLLHFPDGGKVRVRDAGLEAALFAFAFLPTQTNQWGEPVCPACGMGIIRSSDGLTCGCGRHMRAIRQERLADIIPVCRCGSPLMYDDEGSPFCPECGKAA